eukprot:COSAG04_NODE_3933_length_2413_cov_2.364304_3_plen_52_part_00
MAGCNIVLTMVVGPRVLGESVTRDHYSAAAVIMVRPVSSPFLVYAQMPSRK